MVDRWGQDGDARGGSQLASVRGDGSAASRTVAMFARLDTPFLLMMGQEQSSPFRGEAVL